MNITDRENQPHLHKELTCTSCNKPQRHGVYPHSQVARCETCSSEQSYTPTEKEQDANYAYFWFILPISCRKCGGPVEKNNREGIGYCWNENCKPKRRVLRRAHRCPNCGSFKINFYRPDFGCYDEMRCDNCGEITSRKHRSAC